MHPNGQIPAYEWAFDDVNPPVHAWAALRVFEIDGAGDFDFLARVLHKLLLNFTWWVNRKDAGGNNVFEGGFLGLDNIGPFDRGAALPVAGVLEQSDGTAWMAMYALNLLEMALVLAPPRPHLRGHGARSSSSTSPTSPRPPTSRACGTTRTRFFYDVLRLPDGRQGAAEGALDGRPAPAGGDHHAVLGDAGPAARLGRAAALVPGQQARSTPTCWAPGASGTASSSGCCPWSARTS